MSEIRSSNVLKPCGYWAHFREVGPFPAVDLLPGDRVRLDWQRLTWQVRASNRRFAVLTRHAPFHPASSGAFVYTIIDWDGGVYGPSNLIGHGYDVSSDDACAHLIAELEAGTVSVSERDRMEIQDVQVLDGEEQS